MTSALPFIDLKAQYAALKASIDARIQRVLDHGQYIMGPEVSELEQALANYTGAKHCVTVASGTEALLISMMALGIGAGDEVVTTPFTFAATAETIVLLGAKPVFVDIEPDTCNIDASLIEAAITLRTKAILPVSLYGQVADMTEINAVAARHGLPVIEDAAQSFGASYQGRRSCALSTLACTSFFPSKPLGCYGDGGALFTDDDALAQAAREIRVHGQGGRYLHTRVGVGGRMDTLQCAVVLGKLERFEWEVAQRLAIGERYRERLSDVPGVQLLAVRPDRDCVWAQYTVMVDERERVQKALQQQGIPTAVHYPRPLHHQPVYAHLAPQDACPHSIAAAQRVMSLPMSADLSEADQRGGGGRTGFGAREMNPTPPDFAQLYDEHPEYAARRQAGSFEQARVSLEVTLFKLPQLLALMTGAPLPRRALEIGCATGELIAAVPVAEAGERVGVDISPANVQEAQRRFGDRAHFHAGDFRSLQSGFDWVILSDVLEHIPDDAGFLHDAAALGEHVLVNLPLEDNLLNRRRHYGPDDISGHLRRYSLADGLALFARSGLVVERYHRVWIHEMPAEVERRRLRREHFGQAYAGGALASAARRALFATATAVRPIGRALFASNLFAVARRGG